MNNLGDWERDTILSPGRPISLERTTPMCSGIRSAGSSFLFLFRRRGQVLCRTTRRGFPGFVWRRPGDNV